MTVTLLHGDCIAEMAALKAEGRTFDAIVTDPPYHLTSQDKRDHRRASPDPAQRARIDTGGFMGQRWDGGDIAFRPDTWRLALDLLEPGGMMACFGGARTQHRMACAIEDAGFEIRDVCLWLYASGFPKSKALLKPAYEPIILARKPGPLRPLAIDACRVATDEALARPFNDANNKVLGKFARFGNPVEPAGRWPANILHSGEPQVLEAFAAFGSSKSSDRPRRNTAAAHNKTSSMGKSSSDWTTGGHNDEGSPARFFYCSKASRAERQGSTHPTTKPVSLVSWLVRLINPPGGTVLDPFAGSGTTGIACIREGFDCVLIEKEAEYVQMIEARLRQERSEQEPQLALAIS